MQIPLRGTVGSLAVICLLHSQAYAAPGDAALPGSADPGRIIEDLQRKPKPTLSQLPNIVISPQAASKAPAGSENEKLTLNKIIVEGATAYSETELAAIYNDSLGAKVPLSKIYDIAADITRHYHDDGYALSRAIIPPQEINDGVIRIRVVEGYVAYVETEGNMRDSSLPRGIVERIRNYRPLNMKMLEQDILLLGDLSGNVSRVVLKPVEEKKGAKNADGGVVVVVMFEDVPVRSSVGIDNYGSRYLGPYEANFQTSFNHLFSPYQQTSLSGMVTSDPSELKYGQVTHRMMLNSHGSTATIQAAYVHSEPGFTLAASEVVSDAINYGISVQHPLIRSRTRSLFISGEFLAKDITTEVLNTPLYDDHLRIATANINFDAVDSWSGANQIQAELSQGIDAFGASRDGSLNRSRAAGESDFTRITAQASRLQSISEEFRLFASASGQYSSSPLLSSEQFGFGGPQFGRAYDSSEITGDNGMAAVIELRYTPPKLTEKLTSELFSYYDIGSVWDHKQAGRSASGASAGAGVRFTYNSYITGSLTIAQPLTRDVAAPSHGDGDATRGYFSFNVVF